MIKTVPLRRLLRPKQVTWKFIRHSMSRSIRTVRRVPLTKINANGICKPTPDTFNHYRKAADPGSPGNQLAVKQSDNHLPKSLCSRRRTSSHPRANSPALTWDRDSLRQQMHLLKRCATSWAGHWVIFG